MSNVYDLEVKNNNKGCCPKKTIELEIGENGFCLYNDKHQLVIDASLILHDGYFKVVRRLYGTSEINVQSCQNITDNGETLRWGYKLI